jgi:hypothetical protein
VGRADALAPQIRLLLWSLLLLLLLVMVGREMVVEEVMAPQTILSGGLVKRHG